ncbi:MAG: hypothetical protein MZV64_00230 [Ignavibacteriales bacterium]|nr:hypothetical protein [Ignavibacteriales bacterium]
MPSISSTGQVAIHKIALIYSGVPQRVEVDENPDFTHSSQCAQACQTAQPAARGGRDPLQRRG